jgi:hypothetical protein
MQRPAVPAVENVPLCLASPLQGILRGHGGEALQARLQSRHTFQGGADQFHRRQVTAAQGRTQRSDGGGEQINILAHTSVPCEVITAVVYPTLRRIIVPPKLCRKPLLTMFGRGQSHNLTSFTTKSLCRQSSGSSLCYTSPGPSQGCPPRQRGSSNPGTKAPTRRASKPVCAVKAEASCPRLSMYPVHRSSMTWCDALLRRSTRSASLVPMLFSENAPEQFAACWALAWLGERRVWTPPGSLAGGTAAPRLPRSCAS